LILLADRLFEHLDLDMAGFFGKLAGGNALAAKGVQRVEQPNGKTARSPQSRRSRQIGDGADVNGRLDLEKSQTFTCSLFE
jgi:hypothetical protein